jgi:hypothetical protein
MTWHVGMSQSDFLINNLICPTLLGTSKGQLGGSCWPSLTTNSRRQLDQKIMRVCISHTHLYPVKSLNHTSPSRTYKMCFWANMQVASTLWPNIKSQKISKRRFNLKWTKCSPRTTSNPVKTRQAPVIRQEEAQDSPAPGGWGRLAPWDGWPTTWSANQARGTHRLNQPRGGLALAPNGGSLRISCKNPMAPCYNYKGRG